jgi:hypothetical protein
VHNATSHTLPAAAADDDGDDDDDAPSCCSIWTSEVSGTISLLGIMAVYLASQELLVLVCDHWLLLLMLLMLVVVIIATCTVDKSPPAQQ